MSYKNKPKSFELRLSESELRKLKTSAYKKGMTITGFVREALENKYKKMLDEEVRQYEHSGVHSEIHKGTRKSDSDHSERGRADWFGDTYRKTGTEG